MQPVSVGSATGSGTEQTLQSAHWDLRRKIALEHLRSTSSGSAYSGTSRHLHTPVKTAQHKPGMASDSTASVKFGQPVGVAEVKPGRRSLLPPLTTPHLFRRMVAQGGAAAQVLDLPLSGFPLRMSQKPHEAVKTKHSVVSVKRIVLFALVTVVVFSFLYRLSGGVATSVPHEIVGLREDFFFSLRSFLTASSFDLAPVNTMGRLLYSIEGVIGMMTMIIISIVVSEKIAKV